MRLNWTDLFTEKAPSADGNLALRTTQIPMPIWKNAWELEAGFVPASLPQLKLFLDLTHIKYGLAKPYCENNDYPLLETRELLPSFESDLWEHAKLPGFSLVAFARPINYFAEIFQFDRLTPLSQDMRSDHAQIQIERNFGAALARLPRRLHESFRKQFQKEDITDLMQYPALQPFLYNMDRAHVFGMHGPNPQKMQFYLAGIYASLPSNLDTEIKRYGQRIGKFTLDNPDSYEANRSFVFQHLMELYGYPVASERRTSAALFARRLHKMGEHFLIRTLGQSDRTLTTLWNDNSNKAYPQIEKIALVKIDSDQKDLVTQLKEEGYFLDDKKRVVILRVYYRQHNYSTDNVRQERALSVVAHELVHPLTGAVLNNVSIIRDTSNMLLRLSDIVHGEMTGRIVYKRNEIVENTDTEEKRLKFLYAWLAKHQRRMIGYSDDFFAGIDKIIDNYLFSPENEERFVGIHEIYQEVVARYSYILQARKVRILEDLHERNYKGSRIGYGQMLAEAVTLLHSLKFEIVSYFDTLVSTVIAIGESILNDRYLLRTYIDKPDDKLTQAGLEIKKNYRKLISLIDEFSAIQKRRKTTSNFFRQPDNHYATNKHNF